MPRPASGQVVERTTARGRTFALRFRAYGRRQYVTLGTAEQGWTRQRAETELENVLADARRGIWRPPKPAAVVEIAADPTFHEFASEWFAAKRRELRPVTVPKYENELPFFHAHRLSQITIVEVDRYRAAKVREGRLSATTINQTITRLAQILEVAVEYGHLDRNPAVGRRRQRVIVPVVARADELLADREAQPLPAGVTAHQLRHTFASILVALGKDPTHVIQQLGHTDPAFTLRVYAHVMRRRTTSAPGCARWSRAANGHRWAPGVPPHRGPSGRPRPQESPAIAGLSCEWAILGSNQ